MNSIQVQTLSWDNIRYPRHMLLSSSEFTMQCIGNLNLLHLSLTALFCSRKCPGDAILKAYDLARELREKETPVISGFHTPVEKDMLEILLKGKGPIVICPARGLEGMRLSKTLKQRIEQNNLLILSCFPSDLKQMTIEMARQRNQLIISLASQVQVIYASPGGEVEKLIRSRA